MFSQLLGPLAALIFFGGLLRLAWFLAPGWRVLGMAVVAAWPGSLIFALVECANTESCRAGGATVYVFQWMFASLYLGPISVLIAACGAVRGFRKYCNPSASLEDSRMANQEGSDRFGLGKLVKRRSVYVSAALLITAATVLSVLHSRPGLDGNTAPAAVISFSLSGARQVSGAVTGKYSATGKAKRCTELQKLFGVLPIPVRSSSSFSATFEGHRIDDQRLQVSLLAPSEDRECAWYLAQALPKLKIDGVPVEINGGFGSGDVWTRSGAYVYFCQVDAPGGKQAYACSSKLEHRNRPIRLRLDIEASKAQEGASLPGHLRDFIERQRVEHLTGLPIVIGCGPECAKRQDEEHQQRLGRGSQFLVRPPCSAHAPCITREKLAASRQSLGLPAVDEPLYWDNSGAPARH